MPSSTNLRYLRLPKTSAALYKYLLTYACCDCAVWRGGGGGRMPGGGTEQAQAARPHAQPHAGEGDRLSHVRQSLLLHHQVHGPHEAADGCAR